LQHDAVVEHRPENPTPRELTRGEKVRAERIRRGTVADESDLLEVYDTERHLLYVACTRATDYLLVSSGDIPSEFLDDLRA
jgi:superfamily I DNA/RNA helicase